MAIEFNETEIVFNKHLHWYGGIFKKRNYGFHYNFMIQILVTNAKVLSTYNDSHIYEIMTETYEEIINSHIHKFDISNYSQNIPYGIPPMNKKVPDLMKDEAGAFLITLFVGLRSKIYTFRINEKCIRTARVLKVIYLKIKSHFKII